MAIRLQNVTKRFPAKDSGSFVPVVDNVDLDVPDGKIVALFGPNGCGKTTILNIVAGIEAPDSGSISVAGNGMGRPTIGYAFQNFRDVLLPWESALENVSFGLRAIGVPFGDAQGRAVAFLEQHGFRLSKENYPYQLSIGQQQIVALARALLPNPVNLLLDEPFAALDHKTRFRMHDLSETLTKTSPTAMVMVSHDVDEALYIGDELVLLSRRPARVLNRYPIPFGRPRRHELLATAEFADLRREVIAAFLKEVET